LAESDSTRIMAINFSLFIDSLPKEVGPYSTHIFVLKRLII